MPDTGRARVRNDNKLSHIDKKNSDMHHHGAIEVKQLNELMGSCGQGFQVYIIGHFQQFQLISILAVTIVNKTSMKAYYLEGSTPHVSPLKMAKAKLHKFCHYH